MTEPGSEPGLSVCFHSLTIAPYSLPHFKAQLKVKQIRDSKTFSYHSDLLIGYRAMRTNTQVWYGVVKSVGPGREDRFGIMFWSSSSIRYKQS